MIEGAIRKIFAKVSVPGSRFQISRLRVRVRSFGFRGSGFGFPEIFPIFRYFLDLNKRTCLTDVFMYSAEGDIRKFSTFLEFFALFKFWISVFELQ